MVTETQESTTLSQESIATLAFKRAVVTCVSSVDVTINILCTTQCVLLFCEYAITRCSI